MPAGTTFLIKEGMLSDKIHNEDVDGDGVFDHYYFSLRNQIIHAVHPLGWIRKLIVKVNGQEIDPEKMYFVIRGQWFCVKQMPTITETFWSMGEEAKLYIKQQGGIKSGTYDVEITIVAATLEETRAIDLKDAWPTRSATLKSKSQVQNKEV